ncbi:unnamed protein product [Clonostachys chloroleuca]|uniref:Aminoglycoside phosphotransferase domain-containing protein n=1 Tax=Clonostachys chloroleuca TaxID=1926264 RepID=A0AA35LTP3_9HYPO|nr:unnamed protein product [Clonostachys chloroleuca]
MYSPHAEVRKAVSLVGAQNLSHPSEALLIDFVKEALNPQLAANYLIDRLEQHQQPASELASHWQFVIESLTRGKVPPAPDPVSRLAIRKRDGNRCCVTGKPGSLLDPLLVVPVLRVPDGWDTTDQPQVLDMLGAFFGRGYRDWWLSYIRHIDNVPVFDNHWLVRHSVAQVFEKGFIKLDRLQPSMIEFELKGVAVGPEELHLDIDGPYPLLGDHSRSRTPTVDARFIGTHARFSRSIRFLDIASTFAAAEPLPDTGEAVVLSGAPRFTGSLLERIFGSNPITTVFFSVWRLIPGRARAAAYKTLRKFGELLYGRTAATVQRLPFGIYLKTHTDPAECRNEVSALALVYQRTAMPTPKVLDAVYGPAEFAAKNSDSYLLMTQLRGTSMDRCIEAISDNDLDHIRHNLGIFLSQLRSIPKIHRSGVTISDTLGEACKDSRIRGGQHVGPFEDEAAFSKYLMFPDDPARRGHKILFTHSDLNPRNILVDRIAAQGGGYRWIVTGIVDWEFAGYYPEYWEYTKAMFEGFRWPRRYNEFVKSTFQQLGDYSAEMDVEKRSWENADHV